MSATTEPVWREWHSMTGAEIDAVPRDRAIVLVTVSPLEVHGPHLPTICDNLEAEALSHAFAAKLKRRDPSLQFLHLPPIYTAADVLPHVGSLAFRPSTILAVLEDLGESVFLGLGAADDFDEVALQSADGAESAQRVRLARADRAAGRQDLEVDVVARQRRELDPSEGGQL